MKELRCIFQDVPETEQTFSIARVRTAVLLSLIAHIVILGIIGISIRVHDYAEEMQYISVELIKTAHGSKLERSVSQKRVINQLESKTQDKEHATSSPMEGIPVTPQNAVMSSAEPLKSAREESPNAKNAYHPAFTLSRIPFFRRQVNPEYPPIERNAGKEARVVVEVFINNRGEVADVKLVESGGTLFDEAVIKAIKASTFEPGLLYGEHVAVKMHIPYIFRLR